MLITGIDPGLTRLGYVTAMKHEDGTLEIVRALTLSSPPGPPDYERIVVLGRRVAELVGEDQPEQVAVEMPVVGPNRRGALKQAALVGAICACIADLEGFHVPAEVSNTSAKKVLTGTGRASKDEMVQHATAFFSPAYVRENKENKEAMADALAMAMTLTRGG